MEEQELRDVLGRNVKFFRTQRHISQAELAEKAEVSVTFLSNLERGNYFPTAKTLCGLVKALDIEVGELFKTNLSCAESKSARERFGHDVRRRINQTLDEIFGQEPSAPGERHV